MVRGYRTDMVTPCISLVTTKFKISNEQIRSLKSWCKEGGIMTRVSTFCVVAALVWKCYFIAKELPPRNETRLMFPADIRDRLHPPLPERFFGNAVITRSATSPVSEVTSSPIQIVANTVKAAIDGISDEFIRSFIDYVEVNKKKGSFPVRQLSKTDLHIASISGMPVHNVDFGWGAPQLITWAEANVNRCVYIIKEPGKDAGLSALVSLDSATMLKFEKHFREELYNCHQPWTIFCKF